jgi:hypothetical protein
MTRKPHEVLATREARAQLPALLERFRQAGVDAEPVVIELVDLFGEQGVGDFGSARYAGSGPRGVAICSSGIESILSVV